MGRSNHLFISVSPRLAAITPGPSKRFEILPDHPTERRLSDLESVDGLELTAAVMLEESSSYVPRYMLLAAELEHSIE